MWTGAGGTNVLIAVEFGRETDGTASLFSVFFAFQCIACEQKWNEEKKKPNSNSDYAKTLFVVCEMGKENVS